MRNPFKKHTEELDELWDVLYEISFSINTLSLEVQELREEVDFLIDELDD